MPSFTLATFSVPWWHSRCSWLPCDSEHCMQHLSDPTILKAHWMTLIPKISFFKTWHKTLSIFLLAFLPRPRPIIYEAFRGKDGIQTPLPCISVMLKHEP